MRDLRFGGASSCSVSSLKFALQHREQDTVFSHSPRQNAWFLTKRLIRLQTFGSSLAGLRPLRSSASPPLCSHIELKTQKSTTICGEGTGSRLADVIRDLNAARTAMRFAKCRESRARRTHEFARSARRASRPKAATRAHLRVRPDYPIICAHENIRFDFSPVCDIVSHRVHVN